MSGRHHQSAPYAVNHDWRDPRMQESVLRSFLEPILPAAKSTTRLPEYAVHERELELKMGNFYKNS